LPVKVAEGPGRRKAPAAPLLSRAGAGTGKSKVRAFFLPAMAAWVDAGQVEKKAEKAEVVQTGMIGSIAEQFQHTWPVHS
jgi:hypothetical protein